MKKKYLEAGKIVGTHGLGGMVRIQPWSDSSSFLSGFSVFYLDEQGNATLKIENVRPHGNVAIAKIYGYDSIEKAEALRNKIIYIDREDCTLSDGRYFISDLLDCRVYDSESKRLLGTITDVSQTGANDVWHITNDGKEYLIPVIDDVLDSVDIDSGVVYITPLRGIFDDEN